MRLIRSETDFLSNFFLMGRDDVKFSSTVPWTIPFPYSGPPGPFPYNLGFFFLLSLNTVGFGPSRGLSDEKGEPLLFVFF